MKNIVKFEKFNESKDFNFIVYTLHYSESDAEPEMVKTFDEAVDLVNSFFLSYGFEIKDGKAYDEGNEDIYNPQGGFECFSDVQFYNGKVSKFTHRDGDGPVAWIEVL